MFCSECGAKNDDDAVFCSECGAKLVKHQKIVANDKDNGSESVKTNNEQSSKVEKENKVNKEQDSYKVSTDKKSSFSTKIIIFILIIVIAICGYFAYTKYFRNDNEENSISSAKTEWGDKYLVYLKEVKEQTDKKVRQTNYGIPEDAKNITLQFIEIPSVTDPIMVINYIVGEKEYAIIYYISKNGEIDFVSYNKETNIEYLYNIELKKFDWYIHSISDGNHSYTLLEKAIKNLSMKDNSSNTVNSDVIETEVTVDYTFTSSEMDKKSTSSRYNQTFVDTDIEDSSKTDIDLDSENENLKDKVNSAIDAYKPSEELITEQNKQDIEEKAKEIEKEAILSKEEALEIGRDLYDYGSYPGEYDYSSYTSYLGKSKMPMNNSETITVNEVGLGYKFGTPSDVEDYFTEKRIKEIGENGDPYGLKKIGNDWWYVMAPVGSDPTYIGYILEVKEITQDKITFVAKTYNSLDFLNSSDEPASIYEKDGEEFVRYVINKYSYDVKEDDFVIVLEDGKWKIDEQVINY